MTEHAKLFIDSTWVDAEGGATCSPTASTPALWSLQEFSQNSPWPFSLRSAKGEGVRAPGVRCYAIRRINFSASRRRRAPLIAACKSVFCCRIAAISSGVT